MSHIQIRNFARHSVLIPQLHVGVIESPVPKRYCFRLDFVPDAQLDSDGSSQLRCEIAFLENLEFDIDALEDQSEGQSGDASACDEHFEGHGRWKEKTVEFCLLDLLVEWYARWRDGLEFISTRSFSKLH